MLISVWSSYVFSSDLDVREAFAGLRHVGKVAVAGLQDQRLRADAALVDESIVAVAALIDIRRHPVRVLAALRHTGFVAVAELTARRVRVAAELLRHEAAVFAPVLHGFGRELLAAHVLPGLGLGSVARNPLRLSNCQQCSTDERLQGE